MLWVEINVVTVKKEKIKVNIGKERKIMKRITLILVRCLYQ